MRRKIREWDESPYEFIKSKEVLDTDGFVTDYTWYYDSDDGVHFFMFGDRDLYTPNRDYADWECDTYEEAEEWFWNYGMEQEIDDYRFYEGANKMNKGNKGLREGLYNIFYDYEDEGGYVWRDNQEEFEGDWHELQNYIKSMRKNGCYNIDAAYVEGSDGEYDDIDESLHDYDIIKKYKYDGRTYGLMRDHFDGGYFASLIDSKGNVNGPMTPFESLKDAEKYFEPAVEINESLKEEIADNDIDKVYKKLSKLNKVDFGKLEDEYLRTRPSVKDAVYKFYGTILNAKSYCKDFIKWVKEEKGIDLKGLPCKKNESLKGNKGTKYRRS